MDKLDKKIEKLFSFLREVEQINNEMMELLVEVLQLLGRRNYAKYSKKYNILQEKVRILNES